VAPTFAELMARDAQVFLGGPATGFGVVVKNGSTQATGLVDDRYVMVDENGFQSQRKVKVLRLKTGEGGTIAIDTELEIGGVTYRVDGIEPVAPDRVFTEYVLAGGTA
jgi:hypothetical protein